MTSTYTTMVNSKSKRKTDSDCPQEFDTDKYTCKFCLKRFSRTDHCTNHIKLVHTKEKKLETLNCNICDKTFYSEENLRRHILSHSEKEVFSCPKCSKKYQSYSALISHIKAKGHTYPGEQEYPEYKDMKAVGYSRSEKCEICHRMVGRLEHHMKEHHSEQSRTFSCSICEFMTDRKDSLTKHERLKHKLVNRAFKNLDKTLDINNPSWTCFDCKKTLTSMKAIEDHMMLKYCQENSCKTCGKSFTLRYNLLQHVRDVHENPQTFECNHCSKSYAHKSSLTKHLKKCKK